MAGRVDACVIVINVFDNHPTEKWYKVIFLMAKQKSYQGKKNLIKNIVTKTFLCYILYSLRQWWLAQYIFFVVFTACFCIYVAVPPVLPKVNNNISNSLGWVLDKTRSGLPHCLKTSGRSEEERGPPRAGREADGWSGGCVPSGRVFWKRQWGWRGYFNSADNSSSWKCPALSKPPYHVVSLSKKTASYLAFSPKLWKIFFFNICTIVLYTTLSEINWQLL